MTAAPLALALALAASDDVAAPVEAPRASPPGDVELHVPKAEVGKLSLDVKDLEARLDLDTRVAGLVEIRAGIVATVQSLKLEVEDVSAETHLLVRLERVTRVLERALDAVDRRPDLAPAAVAIPVGPAAPLVATDAATEPREPNPAPPPAAPASP